MVDQSECVCDFGLEELHGVDQSECVCDFGLEELHGVDLWSCFGFGSTEF